MHPSEEIYREESNGLMGKTTVFGITGSIADIIANDVDSAGKTSASMLLATKGAVADIIGIKVAISEGILNFVSEKI